MWPDVVLFPLNPIGTDSPTICIQLQPKRGMGWPHGIGRKEKGGKVLEKDPVRVLIYWSRSISVVSYSVDMPCLPASMGSTVHEP